DVEFSEGPLEIMLIDISDTMEVPPSGSDTEVPVIHMTGATMEGDSVLVRVFGFLPYIYAQVPEEFDEIHTSSLADTLERVISSSERQQTRLPRYVTRIEKVDRRNLMAHHLDPEYFVKITFGTPAAVRPARAVLQSGVFLP